MLHRTAHTGQILIDPLHNAEGGRCVRGFLLVGERSDVMPGCGIVSRRGGEDAGAVQRGLGGLFLAPLRNERMCWLVDERAGQS